MNYATAPLPPPPATPRRRQRLQALLVQRTMARVLSVSQRDPSGTPMGEVEVAAVALIEQAQGAEGPVKEKDMDRIAQQLSIQYPVIAAPKAQPQAPRTKPRPPQQPPRVAALLFPPLQPFSPRSRTELTSRTRSASSAPKSLIVKPKLPSEGEAAEAVSRPTTRQQQPPPYALHPAPPSSEAPVPGAASARRKARLSHTDVDAILARDPASRNRAAAATARRERPPDVWARMSAADYSLWKAEQAETERQRRIQWEEQCQALDAQLAARKATLAAEKQAMREIDQATLAHIARQEAAEEEKERAKKAHTREVAQTIVAQMQEAARAKEEVRLYDEACDVKLAERMKKELEEEKLQVAARRQATKEVYQHSLQYNAAQLGKKAEAKERELALDKETIRVMEERAAAEEARRVKHLAALSARAAQQQVMVTALQDGFEEQARRQEQRAEQEAQVRLQREAAQEQAEREQRIRLAAQVHAEQLRQIERKREGRKEQRDESKVLATEIRRAAARGEEDEAQRAEARRRKAESHRREIEAQIRQKEEERKAGLNLTAVELDINRAELRRLALEA